MKVTRQRGESVDSLLRRYKRIRNREKISESLKRHECYEKPSDRRRRKHREAVKRLKKSRKKTL